MKRTANIPQNFHSESDDTEVVAAVTAFFNQFDYYTTGPKDPYRRKLHEVIFHERASAIEVVFSLWDTSKEATFGDNTNEVELEFSNMITYTWFNTRIYEHYIEFDCTVDHKWGYHGHNLYPSVPR